MLRLVQSRLGKFLSRDEFTPYHVNAAERFLATIENTESIVSMPEATFTIFHLIKPHKPTVFTKHGEIIRRILDPGPEEWLGELEFVNSKFLQMVDTILENSENQPVIIFQADHGSIYGDPRTDDNRAIHFDSYAAYYLPNSFSMELPQPFTLINSFLLIMNAIFETDYQLRQDRLFEVAIGYDNPFDLENVTEAFIYQ